MELNEEELRCSGCGGTRGNDDDQRSFKVLIHQGEVRRQSS